MMIDIYSKREKNKLKDDITIAYYNAYFQKCKKLPSLHRFLKTIDNEDEENKKPKKKSGNQLFKQATKLFTGGD